MPPDPCPLYVLEFPDAVLLLNVAANKHRCGAS
jgi:hypothetical protein